MAGMITQSQQSPAPEAAEVLEKVDDGETTGLLPATVDTTDKPRIELASSRYVVVFIFVAVSMLGGFSIDLVQSAQATAKAAFDGLSVSQLSTIQLATQIPGCLSEPWLLQYMGMRNMVTLMAFLNLLGYLCMGGLPFIDVNHGINGLYLGNAFVGFTAGVLLIPCAKIVSDWMGQAERGVMLSLAMNAGNIGTGAGYFLSEAVAGSHHLNPQNVPGKHVDQMRTYINALSVAPFFVFLLAVWKMESEPEFPPSASEAEQRRLKAIAKKTSILEDLMEPWVLWREDLRKTGGFNGLVISIIGFMSMTITIYTTATFLPDMVLAQGLSTPDVAVLGASWFYLNVIGAITLASAVYSMLSQYNSLVLFLAVILVLQVGAFSSMMLGWSSMVFVVIMLALALAAAPGQAVAADFGCNTTFPVNENTIMWWQVVFGQSATAFCNVLFGYVRHWSTVPFAYGFLLEAAVTIAALMACTCWKGQYKRDLANANKLEQIVEN